MTTGCRPSWRSTVGTETRRGRATARTGTTPPASPNTSGSCATRAPAAHARGRLAIDLHHQRRRLVLDAFVEIDQPIDAADAIGHARRVRRQAVVALAVDPDLDRVRIAFQIAEDVLHDLEHLG